MLTYSETKQFRDEHNLCLISETNSDSVVRILCKTHNKSLVASIPTQPEECECCNNKSWRFGFGLWLCQPCFVKEANQKTMNDFEKKKQAAAVLAKDNQVNTSIETREDIFNAATVSFQELEKAIREENKDLPESEQYYKFANEVKERIENYKRVIFRKHEEILETQNKIRAGQQYISTIVNKLRQEVREEFKIKDAAYKPAVIKAKPVKTVKPKSPGVNDKELKARVEKLQKEGVIIANEYLFRMQMIRHNNDYDKAEGWIRQNFKETMSLLTSKGE